MKTKYLQRRYERLKKKLIPKGWICMGTAVTRTYQRGAGGKKKQFGPYYSWTRKIDNKTVTLALTRQQYDLIREAIRRHQSLNKTLAALRETSLQYIISATPCVLKRKKRLNVS